MYNPCSSHLLYSNCVSFRKNGSHKVATCCLIKDVATRYIIGVHSFWHSYQNTRADRLHSVWGRETPLSVPGRSSAIFVPERSINHRLPVLQSWLSSLEWMHLCRESLVVEVNVMAHLTLRLSPDSITWDWFASDWVPTSPRLGPIPPLTKMPL